jgi:succinate-acetate transporter protein
MTAKLGAIIGAITFFLFFTFTAIVILCKLTQEPGLAIFTALLSIVFLGLTVAAGVSWYEENGK